LILLIDIGNSCIKCATLQGTEIVSSSRHEYSLTEIALDWLDTVTPEPGVIYVSSVGSELIEHQLDEACRDRWNISPIKLNTTSYCAGVSNGYHSPMTLGVDRWAAMIGAYLLVHSALLVVDCGTACSADVVDRNGRHLGGAIIPGLGLMQQSLRSRTTRIGTADDGANLLKLGVSTSSCIKLGAIEALLGFIERMERIAVTQVGEGVTVLITGGDAPALLPLLKSHIRYEKDLVFLGMGGMLREKGGVN
jgi:type III pantothenate kinase